MLKNQGLFAKGKLEELRTDMNIDCILGINSEKIGKWDSSFF